MVTVKTTLGVIDSDAMICTVSGHDTVDDGSDTDCTFAF